MAMLFYIEPSNIFQGSFPGFDSSLEGYIQQELMKPHIEANSADNNNQMVDYKLNNPPPPPLSSNFCCSNSFNKLSSADVMQYVEFDPKSASNVAKSCEEETAIDRFVMVPHDLFGSNHFKGLFSEERSDERVGGGDHKGRTEENTSLQQSFHGKNVEKSMVSGEKSKRKRPRTIKTSEEVESQRMTHISVERNRRKQMNEHLRILRSLMPHSYVQRGDQASIIGGAIEFVRELEQLLQCLESQKRRRIYGDDQVPIEDHSLTVQQPDQAAPIFPTMPTNPNNLVEHEIGLQEETAESKSCLADVEVKLIGFDGLIKIVSRRRPDQLIKTIAALEDLQLHILHINVTTIEQSVLYSFNVKMSGEARLTAEDIADSIQQILSFIHANSSMMH